MLDCKASLGLIDSSQAGNQEPMGSCSNSNELLVLHPTRIGFFLAWLLAPLCRIVHVACCCFNHATDTPREGCQSETRGRGQGQGRGLSFFEKY